MGYNTSMIHGIDVPDSSQANNVPTDLQKIVTVLETGSLIKRLTSTQIAALTGAKKPAGLVVYNTTTNSLQQSNGASFGDVMPTGAIVAYGGTTAPAGWAICDGSAHGSAALQTLIGSANTPDLRDRFIVGVSGTKARGATGGAETHTLTANEMPSHTHTATTGQAGSHTHTTSGDGTHTHNLAGAADATLGGSGRRVTGGSGNSFDSVTAGGHDHTLSTAPNHSHTVTVASTGGGAAHNNMPPYYALVYIIKTI